MPGIGETLARRIVAARQDQETIPGDGRPVFTRPADLTRVRGIGGKTVRRLRQFLRVDGGR